MLYDILIIDDDFSGETVLDEMKITANAASNSTAWEQTIMPFYFDLIKENLKVIWSTGELDDLKSFNKPQLSSVKYIICDLHLSGIKETDNSKTIISKIMGIMRELNANFNENKIEFLVNSKYINLHKNIESDLQTDFKKEYSEKYSVTAFAEKNAITDKQKEKLLDASLISHIKEQIIKKHLELERCLNKKITKNDDVLKELSFSSKHKIVKKRIKLKNLSKKITNFNETRNFIAHNEINSLSEFNESNKVKESNKIKKFSDLTKYIEDIDSLITKITNAKKITNTKKTN